MLNYTNTIHSLPPEYREKLTEKNHQLFRESGLTIIVLDDDPTGTQTIYDVPVLTTWEEEVLESALAAKIPLFFILTNSRSMMAAKAEQLAIEIGKNIQAASGKTGRKTLVISRGDSTLRGHYPNEVDALGQGLEINHAPQILIPAFFQGGRVTIDDVHYVRDGEYLIPAGETPFARDASFGYRSSNLKEYVEEKTGGRIKAQQVVSIGLGHIRKGGPDTVARILASLHPDDVCIVNAANQTDLDVFTTGFYYASKSGMQPVLFRTAASIIPSLAGLPLKTPLEKNQLNPKGKGGVVAIGSYVPVTCRQLDFLQENLPVKYLEIQVRELFHQAGFITETQRVASKLNEFLEKDHIVVIYTSREIMKGNSPEESLQIVNQISSGMVKAVSGIHIRPKFFIAKGGITSSDILTKSFKVKKAQVLGQIIPGVPVWQLNDCLPFPGLIYMPFPGNLGGDDAIYRVIGKFNETR